MQYIGNTENLINVVGNGTYRFKHYQTPELVTEVKKADIMLDSFKFSQKTGEVQFLESMIPQSLSITAANCRGNQTTTIINYTMTYLKNNGEFCTDTGSCLSASFPQNTSTTQTILRTIKLIMNGLTATTNFTQGIWINEDYTLTLSGISSYGFEKNTSILSLDQSIYDGPYQSTNYNIDSSYAVAKINVTGYTNFSIWINSYAESSYDYTVSSEIDAASYPTDNTTGYTGNGYSTSYGGIIGALYSNTRSFQNNPSIGLNTTYWRKITYALDGNAHFIYITYRKDYSAASSNDRGYFVIER